MVSYPVAAPTKYPFVASCPTNCLALSTLALSRPDSDAYGRVDEYSKLGELREDSQSFRSIGPTPFPNSNATDDPRSDVSKAVVVWLKAKCLCETMSTR